MSNAETVELQIAQCKKNNVPFLESPYYLMVGLSKNFDKKQMPINGLRHPTEGATTGWYIWSGENFSNKPDFFEPVHCMHLLTICPTIVKFLGLPPGWRFLVAGDYQDLWVDDELFNIASLENNSMMDFFVRHKNLFLGGNNSQTSHV